MSTTPFGVVGTRFVADDPKATYRPSPLMALSVLEALPCTPVSE